MEFELPKDSNSIIKVIGVGGGGSNAVNHMYNQGFTGVDFIVCNTDKQALDASPVPRKIQLGASLTEGRGAGTIPEIGMNAAIENIDDIKEVLMNNTKMVFVTAGMGGGTGTGAAPVIAKTAKDMGILTVGIVTVPFNFEGRKRRQQAENGLESMRQSVDTLLVINNERLREIFGNLTLGNAFAQADDILSTAAKGISDVISVTGAINVDFNDVNTVMKDSGVAVMGSATAEGENRAIDAVKAALSSPLLNDNDIEGAEYVLLNITYGSKEVLMDEIADITDYIQDEAGSTADVIWGHGSDETLGEKICVTLIATGFKQSPVTGFEKSPEKKVQILDVANKKEIITPLIKAISGNKMTDETIIEEPYLKSDSPESISQKDEKTEEEITPYSEEDFEFEIEDNQGEEEIIADEEAITKDWEIKTIVASDKQETNLFSESEEVSVDQDEQHEIKRYYLTDDQQGVEDSFNPSANAQELTKEELQKRAEERMDRIKSYTSHLNKADGISELEKVPAFQRRNINLDEVKHSSEDSNSRFEVSKKKDDKGSQLRDTNSFLHDNVD
ncbi:MAG: cell division protein FtsZ [Brumimicrobium sp.]